MYREFAQNEVKPLTQEDDEEKHLHSETIPKLASGLLSLLAFALLITSSVKNGIILLVLAFLISPMGLPLLAVQGLGKLQDVNTAMKNFIHS